MGKLILEVFGAVTGLLYVYLEIRHRRSMWLVGLIMAVCYMVVFGTERLYASAALYLYYFIISLLNLLPNNKYVQLLHLAFR